MCNWFLKKATKILNGRQKSTSNFFVGAGDFLRFCWTDQFQFFEVAKTQNLNRKLLQFYYHIPNDMEMCMWFFQGFTEIQNGHHAWTS